MKKKCHSFGMTLHEAQKTVNFIFLNYSEYDFASLITYQIASPHKPKKKKKLCKKFSCQTVQLPPHQLTQNRFNQTNSL